MLEDLLFDLLLVLELLQVGVALVDLSGVLVLGEAQALEGVFVALGLSDGLKELLDLLPGPFEVALLLEESVGVPGLGLLLC